MAGRNLIPAICCFFLFLSLLRVYSEDPAPGPEAGSASEYIDGFVYCAVWNKNAQLVFIGETGGRILLFCNRLETDLFEALRKGAYIRLRIPAGSVTLPQTAGNPGGFDQKRYLASRNIKYMLYPKTGQIEALPETEASASLKWKTFHIRRGAEIRDHLSVSLSRALGAQNAAVAMAVLTGDTGGIAGEDLQQYRDAGIAHVLAVSGLHVGFVQRFILRLLSRKKIGYTARSLSCIFALLAFACIADFSPSVTRAVLQSSYILLAKALRRPHRSKNALCAACAVQLAVNPYMLCNTGFLLSYAAALSLLTIRPALAKRIFFFGKIPACIVTGISVNLGMLPLLITYFNSFSPIGIFATLFAAKLAYWICMSGFAIWIVGALPLGAVLLKIPAALTSAALHALRQVSAVGSQIPPPIGAFRVPSIAPCVILLYYTAIFVFLNTTCFLFFKKHIVPVAACVIVLFTCYRIRADRTEILFFDVGQGFSALIRTGSVCGLVDGGDGTTDISSLLFKQGVGKLDFLLLTHGHADHSGGICDVLREHAVNCIFLPDNPHDEGVSAVYGEADARGIEVVRIRGAREYLIGDLRIKLYANEAYMISAESSDVNNSSLVMLAESSDGSVFFSGDIERETEDLFTRNRWIGKTDVLAVAHHGSDSGSEAKNISIISPEYAIISVGRMNRYGHPSGRVIETLRDAGAEIYRSDLCGAVRITMRKGTLYPWQKWKTSDPSKII